MPQRRQKLDFSQQVSSGQCVGFMIGAAWATLFLVWTGRTVWCFVPFIAVALLVLVVLLTCLRNRLLPHAYFCIKKQESLLKRHLLERKNAEGFHQRRYG